MHGYKLGGGGQSGWKAKRRDKVQKTGRKEESSFSVEKEKNRHHRSGRDLRIDMIKRKKRETAKEIIAMSQHL